MSYPLLLVRSCVVWPFRQKVEEKMSILERSWQNERSLRLQVRTVSLAWNRRHSYYHKIVCGGHIHVMLLGNEMLLYDIMHASRTVRYI